MKLDDWKTLSPYGKWTCADGREVLFNRSYWPILERRPGAPVKAADPNERIPYVQQYYFFDDANCPWSRSDLPAAQETVSRINQVLAEWGQSALPPLTGGRSKLPRG